MWKHGDELSLISEAKRELAVLTQQSTSPKQVTLPRQR